MRYKSSAFICGAEFKMEMKNIEITNELLEQLPGGEILSQGLRDIRENLLTTSACLVLIGAPRLSQMGIEIPTLSQPPSSPEHALYDLLCQQPDPGAAHSQYNALIRRLVSLERALESLRN